MCFLLVVSLFGQKEGMVGHQAEVLVIVFSSLEALCLHSLQLVSHSPAGEGIFWLFGWEYLLIQYLYLNNLHFALVTYFHWTHENLAIVAERSLIICPT